jgi:hypothetical protein
MGVIKSLKYFAGVALVGTPFLAIDAVLLSREKQSSGLESMLSKQVLVAEQSNIQPIIYDTPIGPEPEPRPIIYDTPIGPEPEPKSPEQVENNNIELEKRVVCQDSEKSSKFTINDYIKAIFTIESSNNPRAERFEKHLNDTSYGLGQILTKTAKYYEKKHPTLSRLGETNSEVKESLMCPNINAEYTRFIYQDLLKRYQGDPFLAVAAYNAGPLAPRNARVQQQLNDIYNTNLKTDGSMGKETKSAIRRFQKENGLKVDGILGNNTYKLIQRTWEEKFPGKDNRIGIIPQNNYTPNHVRKFKYILESSSN